MDVCKRDAALLRALEDELAASSSSDIAPHALEWRCRVGGGVTLWLGGGGGPSIMVRRARVLWLSLLRSSAIFQTDADGCACMLT